MYIVHHLLHCPDDMQASSAVKYAPWQEVMTLLSPADSVYSSAYQHEKLQL